MKSFLIRLYGWLLQLDPRQFREKFAEDMQTVFIDTIADTAEHGNTALIQIGWRELRDPPLALIRKYLGERKLSWLDQHSHVWHLGIVILLLVAMAGPWWFDLINVPAQFKCTTAIRLEGDFCGIPIAGSWLPLTAAGGFIPMIVELLTGTATPNNRIRDLFISLLMLLPVLPFISSLLMLLGRQSRRWQVFHIIALGLAICYPLFMGTILINTAGYPRVWWMLWGLWLYIGVTVIALVLEVLTLMREKKTRLGI